MSEPNAPVNVEDMPEPANLRFLRRLVTVLTATMILGLLTIVVLFVIKFVNIDTSPMILPDAITLPEGESARAVTQGQGWIGIVSVDAAGIERFRILNMDGTPRQVVIIEP